MPDSKNPSDEKKGQGPSRLTRRKFLSYAGLLGATPLVGQLKTIQKRIIPQPKIELTPTPLIFSVLRPEDLLYLEFEFINFRLVDQPTPRLIKTNPAQPAYMIVHFPPQSIAEEAFYETSPELGVTGGAEIPKPPPVFSRISGKTRLSFLIPAEFNEIPLNLESLLAWHLYQPSLVPVALPPEVPGQPPRRTTAVSSGNVAVATRSLLQGDRASGQSLFVQKSRLTQTQAGQITRTLLTPSQPQKEQTAIEFPYRLILSPNIYNIWLHKTNPISINGWTELWHTRLAALNQDGSASESDNPYMTVRAVWSPDVDLTNLAGPPASDKPRLAMNANDRHQIVHLTSNFNLPGTPRYTPLPVKVNRMMLSPLGAWFEAVGNWPPNSPLATYVSPIITWQHLATMGRDHYVKIVRAGYLLPFGHRAALVTVTERKFYKTQDGQNVAYLFQKKYIQVRDPERIFPVPFQQYEGREIPFSKVKLTNLITPPIDKPELTPLVPGAGEQAFWPSVGGNDFQFHVIATDVEGKEVEFNLPMAYVGGSYAFGGVNQTVQAYNAALPQRRQPDLLGQIISFAEGKKKGDTSFEVETLTWQIREHGTNYRENDFANQDQPMCFPVLEKATVSVPALKNLVGFDNTAVKYPEVYIKNGFKSPANKGELFFQVLNPPRLDFAAGGKAEKSGGIATPSFSIVGISRILGPVGAGLSSAPEPQPEASSGPLATTGGDALQDALSDIISGTFDPKKFFGDQAKILGGILLQDVIDKVNDFTSPANTGKALNIKTEQVYESDGKTPAGIKTLLKWTPNVHDFLIFVASRDGTKSTLTLDV
ncbi:MAG: hypothetical protein ACPLRA_03075, partial [Candidatus Saccharicenans sp.]